MRDRRIDEDYENGGGGDGQLETDVQTDRQTDQMILPSRLVHPVQSVPVDQAGGRGRGVL